MALTQVSTGGIKDGQVQTADIADAQITAGKLHADALDRTYTLGEQVALTTIHLQERA